MDDCFVVGVRTRDRSVVVVVVAVVVVVVGTVAVGTADTAAGARSHAENSEVSICVVEQVVVHQRMEIVVLCSAGDVVQEEVEVDCVGVHVDFLIVVMVVHR